jgi:hypothetical protein
MVSQMMIVVGLIILLMGISPSGCSGLPYLPRRLAFPMLSLSVSTTSHHQKSRMHYLYSKTTDTILVMSRKA